MGPVHPSILPRNGFHSFISCMLDMARGRRDLPRSQAMRQCRTVHERRERVRSVSASTFGKAGTRHTVPVCKKQAYRFFSWMEGLMSRGGHPSMWMPGRTIAFLALAEYLHLWVDEQTSLILHVWHCPVLRVHALLPSFAIHPPTRRRLDPMVAMPNPQVVHLPIICGDQCIARPRLQTRGRLLLSTVRFAVLRQPQLQRDPFVPLDG